MNLQKYNRRFLIKRTDISTIVPTIPSGVTDVNDHTAGGWLDTDIYVGEMFINVQDNRIWYRGNSGIIELNTASGGSSLFTDLLDTPASYSGQSHKILSVNGSETGLEFIDSTIINNITDLNDTPSTISNDKILVGSASTYIEKDYIDSFDKLSDSFQYNGNGNKILIVNGSENGITGITGNLYYVDLLTNQTISGTKSFTDLRTSNFTLNTKNITDVTIDSGLTSVSDSTLVSSKAIKEYVDNQVITSVGGSYVDLSSNQDINGEKTFNDTTIFNEINVTGNINLKNIYQKISSIKYFGDESTDGSYRIFINSEGYLETQKRISGEWKFMNQI